MEKESHGKWKGSAEANPLGATPSPVPRGAHGPALTPSRLPRHLGPQAPQGPPALASGAGGAVGASVKLPSGEAPPARGDRDGGDSDPTLLSGR